MTRIILALMAILIAMPASAQSTFDFSCVQQYVDQPLKQVGTGKYRRLGFNVYQATLFAPDGIYDPNQPYALSLKYARNLDKETIVDTIADNIKEQNVADEPTLAQWKGQLDNIIGPVKENDVLTGVFMPGKNSVLVHNCSEIGNISDAEFTKAFFAIWLGPTADPDMRGKLTAQR
jgi:hypothetical protein